MSSVSAKKNHKKLGTWRGCGNFASSTMCVSSFTALFLCCVIFTRPSQGSPLSFSSLVSPMHFPSSRCLRDCLRKCDDCNRVTMTPYEDCRDTNLLLQLPSLEREEGTKKADKDSSKQIYLAAHHALALLRVTTLALFALQTKTVPTGVTSRFPFCLQHFKSIGGSCNGWLGTGVLRRPDLMDTDGFLHETFEVIDGCEEDFGHENYRRIAKSKLHKRMRVRQVPGDGSCLFHSLTSSLAVVRTH